MVQYYHMLEFYQKKSWRSVFKSWWFVGVLAVLCLFMLYVVYDRYTIERDMASRRSAAEASLRELEERRAHIEDKVQYLSSDRGIEAEMRRNFDVAQPGEQVVIILDPEVPGNTIQPLPPIPDTPPWYLFWR
jgi:cell division protein FtsB